MPRPKRPRAEPKVRLNLEVSPQTRERLMQLRVDCGYDSTTEVVRRAIGLLSILVRHKLAGGTVVLRKPGEADQRLVIL